MKNNICNIIFFALILIMSVQLKADDKVVNTYHTNDEIIIDGKLNEDIWKKAIPLTGFTQKDPIEGAEPEDSTKIYIVYDDKYLYLGARMYRENPEEIQAFVSRRDNMGNSERIIISLDTFFDRRTSYTFALTATSVRADYYHPTDNENDRDYSYNPVWIGRANIDSTGWSAEFEIPFSQLRFNDQDSIKFGINANKWTPYDREDAYWVMVPRNGAGWASRFGVLNGIKGIENRRGVELLPYLAGSTQFDNNIAENDPYFENISSNLRAGLDLKFGIGSNMTLDATINPDFGQVEADPAVVNLSEFEIFFDEQRPFFLERQTLFSGYGSNYFYSRRIGAAPNYRPKNADFVDRPDFTRILGAAKLTGRTSEGLSVGALSSMTEATYADTYFADNDSTANMLIEPLATYNVVRMQQEFGKARNSVGFIATGVERNFNENDEIANAFNKRAYTGGIDYYFTFLDRTYELQGHLGGSYIQGNKHRLYDIQRFSTHFYQRPDASHVELDSNITSLSGYAGSLQFNKISGKHWLFDNTIWFETPGFELNDIGSLARADNISYTTRLRYRENRSTDIYHSYNISLRMRNEWNFEGVKLNTGYLLSYFMTFATRSTINTYVEYEGLKLRDTKTRGGPMMAEPYELDYGINYNSDWTRLLTWNFGTGYKHGGLDVEQFELNGGCGYNYGRIRVNFSFSYSYENDPLQYVTTFNNGSNRTYGKRYVFANLKRNELSFPIRFDLAITPDMTLEFYGEPFISDGDFSGFGELEKPRTYDLLKYGEEGTAIDQNEQGNYIIQVEENEYTMSDPDFHFISFRSNLVFRWEWIPGSTLFFVWQQNRSQFDSDSFGLNTNDFQNVFNIRGTNTLALKLTYWLPVNWI